MIFTKPEGVRLNAPENLYYLSSPEHLHEAYQKNIPLEARAVSCDCEHNLRVELGALEGIIYRDECALGIDDGEIRDIAVISRVNKPVCFYIEGFTRTDGREIAILSRRRVQREFSEKVAEELTPGDIIDARVTHLEPFGAFCDIGCGVTSLLPIDNISVSRIPHPSARFRVSDDIKACVKSFDEFGRITLTHKELLGTWEENASLFHTGETVSGIIRSIESYGVFVELTPNLAGLAESVPDCAVGDHASVYIKSIIPDKMKFKLIIVDSFRADYPPKKPEYYIDKGHIDRFRYSPDGCEKITETLFM